MTVGLRDVFGLGVRLARYAGYGTGTVTASGKTSLYLW